jgi:hypothetical protein
MAICHVYQWQNLSYEYELWIDWNLEVDTIQPYSITLTFEKTQESVHTTSICKAPTLL